ncbi:uncharacterized protein LOC116951402 [Petromyzon marinus]|uniref:uncharacterized protein LOC116951402 n=1 Tax=Petromyzon marinus TaxID=7757 RepID=UPI003F706FEF
MEDRTERRPSDSRQSQDSQLHIKSEAWSTVPVKSEEVREPCLPGNPSAVLCEQDGQGLDVDWLKVEIACDGTYNQSDAADPGGAASPACDQQQLWYQGPDVLDSGEVSQDEGQATGGAEKFLSVIPKLQDISKVLDRFPKYNRILVYYYLCKGMRTQEKANPLIAEAAMSAGVTYRHVYNFIGNFRRARGESKQRPPRVWDGDEDLLASLDLSLNSAQSGPPPAPSASNAARKPGAVDEGREGAPEGNAAAQAPCPPPGERRGGGEEPAGEEPREIFQHVKNLQRFPKYNRVLVYYYLYRGMRTQEKGNALIAEAAERAGMSYQHVYNFIGNFRRVLGQAKTRVRREPNWYETGFPSAGAGTGATVTSSFQSIPPKLAQPENQGLPSGHWPDGAGKADVHNDSSFEALHGWGEREEPSDAEASRTAESESSHAESPQQADVVTAAGCSLADDSWPCLGGYADDKLPEPDGGVPCIGDERMDDTPPCETEQPPPQPPQPPPPPQQQLQQLQQQQQQPQQPPQQHQQQSGMVASPCKRPCSRPAEETCATMVDMASPEKFLADLRSNKELAKKLQRFPKYNSVLVYYYLYRGMRTQEKGNAVIAEAAERAGVPYQHAYNFIGNFRRALGDAKTRGVRDKSPFQKMNFQSPLAGQGKAKMGPLPSAKAKLLHATAGAREPPGLTAVATPPPPCGRDEREPCPPVTPDSPSSTIRRNLLRIQQLMEENQRLGCEGLGLAVRFPPDAAAAGQQDGAGPLVWTFGSNEGLLLMEDNSIQSYLTLLWRAKRLRDANERRALSLGGDGTKVSNASEHGHFGDKDEGRALAETNAETRNGLDAAANAGPTRGRFPGFPEPCRHHHVSTAGAGLSDGGRPRAARGGGADAGQGFAPAAPDFGQPPAECPSAGFRHQQQQQQPRYINAFTQTSSGRPNGLEHMGRRAESPAQFVMARSPGLHWNPPLASQAPPQATQDVQYDMW